MFRDLYKSANEEIKGDRAILEKAFKKAEEPERKPLPVFKYSFVGTVVAAVIIVGALFANTDLFTDKINIVPKQNADITATEAPNAEKDFAYMDKVNDTAFLESTENAKQEDAKNAQTDESKPESKSTQRAAAAKGDAGKATDNKDAAFTYEYNAEDDAALNDEDLGISVASLNDEDYDTAQSTEADAVGGLKKAFESDNVEETDDFNDELSTGGIVASTYANNSGGRAYNDTENREEKMFSYMYDLSHYGDAAETEGFVNTTVSPVTNGEEAIERAKSECTIGYDNALAYYDKVESMWKVVFTGEKEQSVYMNTDGITTLIVYIK